MSKYKFYKQDIPDNETIDSYLIRNTDIEDQCSRFRRDTSGIIELQHNLNVDLLREAVQEAYDLYGWHGFLISGYIDDENVVGREKRSDRYGGLSITYNPDYKQNIDENCQTLGNVRYNLPYDMWAGPLGGQIFERVNIAGHDIRAEFYNKVSSRGPGAAWRYLFAEKIITEDEFNSKRDEFDNLPYNDKAVNQVGKNTYSDAMSFNKLSPACNQGYLGEIFNSIPRTLVRGRIVTMKHGNLHWHRDEHIYINFRINIPLYLDTSTIIKTKTSRMVMHPGYMYSWDTGEPHCVERVREDVQKRVNIVFGISPWFDWNEEDQSWESNQYYGEVHPIDMLHEGFLVDFK